MISLESSCGFIMFGLLETRVDVLQGWGIKVLQFLDSLQERSSSPAEMATIRKKLDWIEQLRPDFAEWRVILDPGPQA
jgi:hypothetical protein